MPHCSCCYIKRSTDKFFPTYINRQANFKEGLKVTISVE